MSKSLIRLFALAVMSGSVICSSAQSAKQTAQARLKVTLSSQNLSEQNKDQWVTKPLQQDQHRRSVTVNYDSQNNVWTLIY